MTNAQIWVVIILGFIALVNFGNNIAKIGRPRKLREPLERNLHE